jgi:hypothetical protein
MGKFNDFIAPQRTDVGCELYEQKETKKRR